MPRITVTEDRKPRLEAKVRFGPRFPQAVIPLAAQVLPISSVADDGRFEAMWIHPSMTDIWVEGRRSESAGQRSPISQMARE